MLQVSKLTLFKIVILFLSEFVAHLESEPYLGTTREDLEKSGNFL